MTSISGYGTRTSTPNEDDETSGAAAISRCCVSSPSSNPLYYAHLSSASTASSSSPSSSSTSSSSFRDRNSTTMTTMSSSSSAASETTTMQQKFSFTLDHHHVYGVLVGFHDAQTVRFYSNLLSMIISEAIQSIPTYDLDCEQREQLYTKLLRDAFATVEESYRRQHGDLLSEKTMMDIQLQGSAPEQYPAMYHKLQALSRQLSAGLSAAVTLIYDHRLYAANIGDTRTIVCRRMIGPDGRDYIQTVKLLATHDLGNANELRRLASLGLDIERIRRKRAIGNCATLTRCLGNLWIKNFYKDYADLAAASGEPISAEPDVASFALDHTTVFLALVSPLLFDAFRSESVNGGGTNGNEDFVHLVYDEFRKQSNHKQSPNNNLDDITRSVVNRVKQRHQSCFAMNVNAGHDTPPLCMQLIDDNGLLLLDFRFDDNAESANRQLAMSGNAARLEPINISVSGEPNQNYESSDSGTQHTRVDNDKTITDRLSSVSLSQTNLADDSGVADIEEESEIDPYVDFSDLLAAYPEDEEEEEESGDESGGEQPKPLDHSVPNIVAEQQAT